MAKKAEFSLETVKKYIFWAVVPIGLLLPVFTTLSAVGSISKLFDDRKKVLTDTKGATEKIAAEKDHPNENTITDIENCTKELIGRVVQAWKTLEKDQRERNIWPIEEDAFREEISKLKFFDEMSTYARERYLNFVNKYLPGLEVYVDRRRIQKKNPDTGKWEEMPLTESLSGSTSSSMSGTISGGGSDYGGMNSGGSNSGGGSDAADMDIMGVSEPPLPKDPRTGEETHRYIGTVDWANPETRTVTSSWVKLPRSNEVWFAQEELWVYHALLSVVKESNLEATGPHNAAVKQIKNILIGQAASARLEARASNRINKTAGAGGDMMSSSSSDSMSSGSMSSGSMSGMEGGSGMLNIAHSEEDVITIKKNNRYVDDKGKPLKADEESQFPQFKRMPICLRLIVDQRKIPEILVNCANCAMPIDVLWVRFNPAAVKPFNLSAYDVSVAAASMGSGGGGMSMGMSSGSSGGMDSGSSGDTGGGSAGGGGGPGSSSEVQVRIDNVGGIYGTNAIPIEIYGCINIFNPVEGAGLQLEPPTVAPTTEQQPAAP